MDMKPVPPPRGRPSKRQGLVSSISGSPLQMSWDGRNKGPQTGSLKQQELTLSQLLGPKSKIKVSEASKRGSFLLHQRPVAPGVPGLAVTSPQSLRLLFLWTLFCVPLGCPFCLKATCRAPESI